MVFWRSRSPGLLLASSPRLRSRCWSFSWVVAAMSATRKSMRPSLFTSPRSAPIEENEV